METKKVLITALILVLFAGLANAAITVTVTTPAANQIYYPNVIDGDEYVSIVLAITDDTAANPRHSVAIQYDPTDGNRWITPDENTLTTWENDLNLSSSNCTFTGVTDVWTTGATCTINYLIPTTTQIPTGTYIMDVNVVAWTNGGAVNGEIGSVRVFGLDNRYISASVEALLNILPVVLIAAMLIGVVLLGFGAISSRTLLVIVVGAVVSIIAVVVLSGILGVLTP